MREDDATYYRHRALQEQAAAQLATTETARKLHDELCAMYRFRAAMLTKEPRCWTEVAEEQEKEAA